MADEASPLSQSLVVQPQSVPCLFQPTQNVPPLITTQGREGRNVTSKKRQCHVSASNLCQLRIQEPQMASLLPILTLTPEEHSHVDIHCSLTVASIPTTLPQQF